MYSLLLILAMVRSHRMLLYTLEDVDVLEPARWGWLTRACWRLLRLTPVERAAVLVVISLPVIAPLMKLFLSAGRVR